MKWPKAGRLVIETPFASVRGRMRTGGIGMLSFASLFFAAMEQVQAAAPDLAFLDDGVINFKDTQDYKDAKFGIIELTVHATPTTPEYTRFVDDPSETIVLRRTGSSISESHVTNTVAQMLQYQGDQQDALHIFSLGQGPTITGPGGSGTPPPSGPPVFFQNINFNPPPDHDPPPTFPGGGPNGGTNTQNFFIPPPTPPPPPHVAVPPTVSLNELAGNETNPLPVPGISVVNTVSTDLTVLHGTLHVDSSGLPPGVTVTGDDTGHLICLAMRQR